MYLHLPSQVDQKVQAYIYACEIFGFIILLQYSAKDQLHQKMDFTTQFQDLISCNFLVEMLHLDVEVDFFWLVQLLLFAKIMGHGMQIHLHVKALKVNFTSLCKQRVE